MIRVKAVNSVYSVKLMQKEREENKGWVKIMSKKRPDFFIKNNPSKWDQPENQKKRAKSALNKHKTFSFMRRPMDVLDAKQSMMRKNNEVN